MGARTLLLRGAGRAFCSGADLSGGVQEDPERIDRGRALETGFNPLLESMVRLPIPIVSAVSGAAAGGGCGIALAADIVIASRSAYFLLPFAAIGLVPDLGVTWLLPRLAGRARASAMMLLGERITADVAADWGLIYKVVDDDDLTTAATAMAARALLQTLTRFPRLGSCTVKVSCDERFQRTAFYRRGHPMGGALVLSIRHQLP
jgi:2-(1,2-epoxy-1,2-dihydrophenyl)acetyl-CoA isomerase